MCFLRLSNGTTDDSEFRHTIPSVKVPSPPKSSRNYRPSVSCALCRKAFKTSRPKALFDHLNEHFRRLKLSYWCAECEIGFVHEADLSRHQRLAKKGECGFAFSHVVSCGGHHPPIRSVSQKVLQEQSLLQEMDNDRFNFCYRLRSWEQSQLQAFVSSTKKLVDFEYAQDKTQSCTMYRSSKASKSELTFLTAQPIREPYRASHPLRNAAKTNESKKNATGPVFSLPPNHGLHSVASLEVAPTCRWQRIEDHLLSDLSITYCGPLVTEIEDSHHVDKEATACSRSSASTASYSTTSCSTLSFSAPSFSASPYSYVQPRIHPAHTTLTSEKAPSWQSYLCQASFAGDYSFVKSLLQSGIETNFLDNHGYSPLHYASAGGHEAIIMLLAKHSANVDIACSAGETPLHIAARRGRVRIADILVGNSLPSGISASVVRTLIGLGAEVNRTDPGNRTALHYAVTTLFTTETVRALLEAGADVHVRTNQGRSVLQDALFRSSFFQDSREEPWSPFRTGNDEIINMLKESGAFEPALYDVPNCPSTPMALISPAYT